MTRDTLTVETSESVAFAYELAGPASRGAALAVDTAVLGVLIVAEAGVGYALGALAMRAFGERAVPWTVGAVLVVAFATYWGYYIWGEVVRNGRTPGKRLLGIRVVRDDGGRLGVLDSVIRNLIRLIDLMPGYYAVGLVAMLVSGRAKRLGDMAAGTVVVRDVGDVSLYFDGETRSKHEKLVREFLTRRAGLTPAARWQVAVEILAAYGEQPQPGWDEPTVAGRLADLSGVRGPAGDGDGAEGPTV